MAYFLRIELKEDLEWLQNLLGNSVEKLKAGGLQSAQMAAANIYRVHESVINAVPAKEAEKLGITAEEFPEDVKEAKPKRTRKATKKSKEEDDYLPNLCKTHPKNEIKRAPRTDCKGCWKAYERLHPLEYDRARRNFERRIKKAQRNNG